MNRRIYPGLLLCLLLFSIHAFGQATATASRLGALQLGVGATRVYTDYTPQKAGGITAYGDLDFRPHWGIDGEIHLGSLITPGHVGEDTYLLGLRYVGHRGRFDPYLRLMGGIGRLNLNLTNNTGSYTYKVGAFAGGVDIHITRSINVRAFDFEAQAWPGYLNGLSPYVVTSGVAYSFH
ncbi:MAG: hypothetical protein KGK08_04235 [Acidobacteriota bacterium]|nr:hypothetical protein [Acidobacteriota bacterium]